MKDELCPICDSQAYSNGRCQICGPVAEQQYCAGCGVKWIDGVGFEKHKPLCANERWGWLWTVSKPPVRKDSVTDDNTGAK